MTACPVIETERLRLRPSRLEDFEATAAFFATERSRFAGGPLDREKAWRGFASDVGQWPLLGFGLFAVDEKASGACIGEVSLNGHVSFPEREIGWTLWDGHEGRGYATEAARAARAFAYETAGWTTAVSYIHPMNAASIRVAERLGATRDAEAPTPGGAAELVYRHPSPEALQ